MDEKAFAHSGAPGSPLSPPRGGPGEFPFHAGAKALPRLHGKEIHGFSLTQMHLHGINREEEQAMDFYTSISKYYDHIFPFSPAQRDFSVQSLTGYPAAKILDIGCATGSLALNLAAGGFQVEAIDFDGAMIESAKKKSSGTDNPHFRKLNMLELAETYGPQSFDAALCFGNTLVHLPEFSDVRKLLTSLYTILKKDSIVMIQILNYDHILDNRVSQLPPIENETIHFSRSYRFRKDRLIDFYTELTIVETGARVHNHISLLPIRKSVLEGLMIGAGFTDLEFFGDFMMNPLTEKSLPLIVRGRKEK